MFTALSYRAARARRCPALEELEERAVPAAVPATDIVLQSVTATGISDLVVVCEIQNRDAPAFGLSFYRSTNSRFDTADTLLSKIRLSGADLSVGVHPRLFHIGPWDGQVALPGYVRFLPVSPSPRLQDRPHPILHSIDRWTRWGASSPSDTGVPRHAEGIRKKKGKK
jgi:hypothetical protein